MQSTVSKSNRLLKNENKKIDLFTQVNDYRCKCSKKTCLNRVVQHPLQLQLQLFKTPNKGWGLRCVNDIPKGTFICIYAGYLYTEETANTVSRLLFSYDGDKENSKILGLFYFPGSV